MQKSYLWRVTHTSRDSQEKAEGRVDIGNWLGKRSRLVSSVYCQKPEIVALGFQMALIL